MRRMNKAALAILLCVCSCTHTPRPVRSANNEAPAAAAQSGDAAGLLDQYLATTDDRNRLQLLYHIASTAPPPQTLRFLQGALEVEQNEGLRDSILSVAANVGYLNRAAIPWLLEVAADPRHESSAWFELRRFVYHHEVCAAMLARLRSATSFGDTESLLIRALAQADRSETEVNRLFAEIAEGDSWPEEMRALARRTREERLGPYR